MGGIIAQQFTIDRPHLVRKLILVWHWFKERRGDGVGNTRDTGDFGAKYDPPDELWLRV